MLYTFLHALHIMQMYFMEPVWVIRVLLARHVVGKKTSGSSFSIISLLQHVICIWGTN